MKRPLEHAVILAAGMGSRLGDRGTEQPKGFLRFGSKPIIVESIEKLLAAGITKITIITGHLSHHYEGLKDRYPQITTLHNAQFRESGSFFSLSKAFGHVAGDFLLLESDIVFEQRALSVLMDDERTDLVLVSGVTHSRDEVWVDHDQMRLRGLSQARDSLSCVLGEFVGITRLSASLFGILEQIAPGLFQRGLHVEYEQALCAASAVSPIGCLKVEDLLWAEVDDSEHFDRVARSVYPRLQSAH
jgi:2-aminoethylphosphonate-pyruvate transaminase